MKNFIKILIFSLFAINTYAQQATEIDSKSVKLPRYADLAAIQAAIPTPQQGMMVYNIGTASNWYFNANDWTNMLGAANLALPFDQTFSFNSGSLFRVMNNGVFGAIGILGEVHSGVGIVGRSTYGASVLGTSVSGNGGEFRTTNGFHGLLVSNENTLYYSYGIKSEISGNGVGIYGYSPSGSAVKGVSLNGIGGQFESTNGPAANFINSTSSFPTVRFRNDVNLGTAIDIQGGIKVSGTNKAAFKIYTGPFISGNKSGIPNTTMANAATDILVVTYEYTGGVYLNKQFATFWNGGNWEIHLTDGTTMPVGITFNVLVIKQ